MKPKLSAIVSLCLCIQFSIAREVGGQNTDAKSLSSVKSLFKQEQTKLPLAPIEISDLDVSHDSKIYAAEIKRPTKNFRASVLSATSTDLISSTTSTYAPIPASTFHFSSKASWVKKFLAFVAKRTTESFIPVPKEHTVIQLSSNIRTYQDLQSDPSQLKAWTRYVVKQDKLGADSDFRDDKNEPKTSPKTTTKLNIAEFIIYLVKHQGFKIEELEFLKSANLDHGYEEIEKELDKIRDRDEQQNKIIDIGGEDGKKSGAASARTHGAAAIVFLLVGLHPYASYVNNLYSVFN